MDAQVTPHRPSPTTFTSANLSTHDNGSLYAGTPILFASPGAQLSTPPRSLFQFNAAPRSAPPSLFSVSPAISPKNTLQSSLISTPSTDSAQVTPTMLKSSPNLFFTPPSVRSEPSTVPNSPNAPRSLSMSDREYQITPSPFKTPNAPFSQFPTAESPTHSGATLTSNFPPMAQSSSVARVLNFEHPQERLANGKRASNADSQHELAPPEPKRPYMPWNGDGSPQGSNAPRQLLTPNTDQRRNLSDNFLPLLPTPSPSSMVLSSPQETIHSQQPKTTIYNAVDAATTGARSSAERMVFPVPSLPERYRSVESSALEIHKPAVAPIPTLQVPTLQMAQFSSYNAALEAQAQLEDDAADKISPEELRESFMVASGNMSSALEELVSQVTQTSDELHTLNLNLQMCNNEVLLMNATLVTDDRLRVLEEYFSMANAP